MPGWQETTDRGPKRRPPSKCLSDVANRLLLTCLYNKLTLPPNQQLPFLASLSPPSKLWIIRRLSGTRWVNCLMGICNSSESTNVATAKLISHDGTLQEFSYPVKVSYVLLKNPTCFICCSDELEFDDVVSAIDEDEELQPGQIYFALPLSRLKRPLQAEEMAALAVKASSALIKNGHVDKFGCRRISVAPVIISGEEFKLARRGDAGGCVVGAAGGKGGRKRKMFMASLSAIKE